MREDGGTPAFLQTIRAALAMKLKDEMGVENISAREKEILDFAFEKFGKLDCLNFLAPNIHERLGVISFYCYNVHHNFIVRLLNDLYGIQVRGGCSCAGTYGHYLFHIDKNSSKTFTDLIDKGDSSLKPGWVRVSLHPTMTNDELEFVVCAVKDIIDNAKTLEKDYFLDKETGEWIHKSFIDSKSKLHMLFD
jgi:selenocysteine lyase/cysteine desulfurase